MSTIATWAAVTSYAKGATVKPSASRGSVAYPLPNGDFETGLTGWTVGTGWASVTGSSPYAGSKFARYTGTGSAMLETQAVGVTPGQVVAATAMARVYHADDGAALVLVWYDASGSLITVSAGNESTLENGTWGQIVCSGTAPPEAASVELHVVATRTAGTSVDVDTVAWTYRAPLTATPLVYRAVQDTAGVSGLVEPVWPTVVGTRVTDGTVIWEATEVSWIEWTAHWILQSGNTEPAWPTTVGGRVRDGSIDWECVSRRVEDDKCPQSKVVAIMASKVFAADGDIIRFSATANPLDWSSRDDAGYLPSGLQQANANDMLVLQPYRSNLCAWNANAFQMWQVDPDPTQMSLLDQMDGVGSTYTLAAQPVANDLFYLAALGVRSIGIAQAAANMQAGDIGMPIDSLVQAAIVDAEGNDLKPIATYYPSAGQYWLTFGDSRPTPGTGLALQCAPMGGTVGEAYSYTFIATGADGPLTFSIASGSLPPGLALDEDTGELSGTPTTEGSYSFAVTVTSADGQTVGCGGWSADGGSPPPEDTVEVVPSYRIRWLAHRFPADGPQLKFSPDGIDWMQPNESFAPNLPPIGFFRQGSKIVLVGVDGQTAYAEESSPSAWMDGASFGGTSSPTARMIGDRLWVGRGGTNGIAYSDDATLAFTNLPNVNHPVSGYPTSNHIIQCGPYLLRAGAYGDFMRSSDGGVTWSAAGRIDSINPGSPYLPILYSVETNGGRLVFGGSWADDSDYRHFVGYSDDYGSTFTISTFPPATPGQPNGIRRILPCGGGTWLAFGYGHYGDLLFKSTDNAVSFVPVHLGIGVQFSNYGTYGIDETTGRTIILAITASDNYRIYQSDDQSTWTNRSYTNGPWPQVYALRFPT